MWTLYTSSGDVVLLNAIFNWVAMAANNVGLVFGFALFAATLLTTRASAAAAIESHRGGAGPVLTKGAYHMLAPIVIAMLFTSSDMKVTLTIENTTTGVVTAVDNVPIIIAAIPVGGSAMANAIAPAITTAMSGVNPVYGGITVAGHGFIDPMRRLLAARGAIEHLGSADTELRIVLGKCLSMDAGTDFSSLNNLVMHAGNSGATAAQSISINGASPTGVGALLFQAAQNTTGLVPELAIGNSTILNCSDAANLVASDLTNALASVEFQRVVQGAVNGLDQPLPGADYGMTQFLNEYNSMRNWKSMSAAIAIGQSQANAELINFLFDEEVSSGLNCAQATESNKTICEATMIQATELERNNLQAAANEVPMLQYSGAFGNYILALIIGLGPVIIMFMMLFGVDSGRCIKTAMHILVWPLLVTNVGAELVNAMLTMQFANFMSSIAQGGFLSPAAIHSAYKELSLQVGVGSHIMASLPVLMSMIFALGEAAGLASVAAEVNPKGNETGKAEAPSVVESSPLIRTTSPDTLRQGEGWYSMEAEGHREGASSSSTFKGLSRSASQTISDTDSRERRESEEKSSVHRVADALAHRNYNSLGLNWSQGETLRKELSNNLRESGTDAASTAAISERGNGRGAEMAVSGGLSSNVGGGGGGMSAGASLNTGLSGRANSSASQRESLTENVNRASDISLAKAVSKTLSGDVGKQALESSGGENSKALSNERSAAQSYVESLTHRDAHTSAIGHALQETDGFVGANQSIRAGELAQHSQSNGEFRQFQRMQGNKFEDLPGAQEHMSRAETDMDSRSTEDIGGDERARTAVVRHMAAVSMARDTSLPELARYAAVKYLAGESNAMQHGHFEAPSQGSFESGAKPIASPTNSTGVAPAVLRAQVAHSTQGNEALADPHSAVDPKAKVRLSSNDGVANAATDQSLHGFHVPQGVKTSDAVDQGLQRADEAGLAAGANSKNVLSRAKDTWFHPSMAGTAPVVTPGKEAPNDAPQPTK